MLTSRPWLRSALPFLVLLAQPVLAAGKRAPAAQETPAPLDAAIPDTEVRERCHKGEQVDACMELIEFYATQNKLAQANYYAERACNLRNLLACDKHKIYADAIRDGATNVPPTPLAPTEDDRSAALAARGLKKLNTFGLALGPAVDTSGDAGTNMLYGASASFGLKTASALSGGTLYSVGANVLYTSSTVLDVKAVSYILTGEFLAKRLNDHFYAGLRGGVSYAKITSPTLFGNADVSGTAFTVGPVGGFEIPYQDFRLGVDMSWMTFFPSESKSQNITFKTEMTHLLFVLGTFRVAF